MSEASRRPMVLVFVLRQWCPYCRWELTGLQTINRGVTELGAELLGVSLARSSGQGLGPATLALRIARDLKNQQRNQ